MKEPTIDELQHAWTEAIYAEDIPGARAETRQKLTELRHAKTTWVGVDENRLRFALDDYLRGTAK
jgi:hypothetical protein